MKKNILKYSSEITILIRNLFFLDIGLIFLGQLSSLSIYKFIKLEYLMFLGLILPFIWLFFFIQKNKDYYQNIFRVYFKYVFLFGLFLMTSLSLNFKFIDNINILKDSINFLNQYSLFLTIITIGLGFFTFYFNKEKIEKEIEEKQNNEKIKEQEREKEFPNKFPKINKIPILRNLIKWMYKEGWGYSIPLVLITILFITTKIGMLIIYTGSYIDEYNHIFSGISFFENGKFFEKYLGETYYKGSYVSILVGFFMFLFGKSILIAKIVPIFIGIINYFLLFKISKYFLSKKYSALLFLIYTISPWIIFNHFYIRFYVFYELALLLITYLFLKSENNIKKIFKNLIIILIINIIIFFGSEKDVHRYIILGISFSFLSFIYLFKLNLLNSKNKIINLIINQKIITKILILAILFLFSWFIFKFNYLIDAIMSKALYFGSLSKSGIPTYFNLFFQENTITTILFFIVIIQIIFRIKNIVKNNKIFLLSILSLLFLSHIFSKPEQQLIRGIFYYLPIFYLISIIGFSIISKIFNKYINSILIILILLSIALNYPNNFLKNPYIPNEINYIEYKKIAKTLEINCKDKQIIALIHNPYILEFYDLNVNYTAYIRLDLILEDSKYYKDKNGIYKTTINDITTITKKEELIKKISNNDNYCIIINEEERHYYRYFDKKNIILLESKYQKEQIGNNCAINIFYN